VKSPPTSEPDRGGAPRGDELGPQQRSASPRPIVEAFLATALPLVALGIGFILQGGRFHALELAVAGAAVAIAYLSSWRISGVAAAAAAIAYLAIEAHYGQLHHSKYWTTVLFVTLILGAVFASSYARLSVRSREAGLQRAVAHIDEIASEGRLEQLLSGERNLTSLGHEISRSRRHNHQFSLLVVRPDDMDDIALRWDHGGVQSVLGAVAETIGTHVRATDVPFRYGAYDFCVLLLETKPVGARVAAERIRLAAHGRRVEFGPGELVDLSVSIGTAGFPDDASTDDDLTLAASVALSKAVELGGNRTVLHSVPPGSPPGWGMATSRVPAPPA
jgi:diguanylate cyclase (GGDEF)-like protein